MKAEDLTDERVAELKGKHGNALAMFTAPNGDIVVLHKPSKAVWNRFVQEVNDENKDNAEATKLLVLSCLAAPSEADVNQLFNEYPAMPEPLAKELTKLAGGDVPVKKL